MYLFLTGRETRVWAGRGRERETQNPLCQCLRILWAVSRAQHGAQTHELWDHGLSRSRMLNWLSHQVPLNFFFSWLSIFFWEREKERDLEWGRVRERGGGRERIPSRLHAVNCRAPRGTRFHEIPRSRWWPEPRPGVRRSTDRATQAPCLLNLSIVAPPVCLLCYFVIYVLKKSGLSLVSHGLYHIAVILTFTLFFFFFNSQ